MQIVVILGKSEAVRTGTHTQTLERATLVVRELEGGDFEVLKSSERSWENGVIPRHELPAVLLAARVALLEECLDEQLADALDGPPDAPDHSCTLGVTDCDGDCSTFGYWAQRRHRALQVLGRFGFRFV